MSEALKPLSLGGVDRDDRPVVDVFDHAFRLRAITRSVQRSLDDVDKQMRTLMSDDDADADSLVTILAGALDALLEPEGENRTKAKTLVLAKWKSDDLSLDGLRRFADDLQERAVAARPT